MAKQQCTHLQLIVQFINQLLLIGKVLFTFGKEAKFEVDNAKM